MKILRLAFHPTNGAPPSNVLFNKADLPDAKPNDVLEISQQNNDETVKILVKITDNFGTTQPISKGSISLVKILGKKFELRHLAEVRVKILSSEELEEISLQHVELVFKDQYYSRSDMLRMRTHLMSDVLYHEQKVELLQMKAQVEELWCNGVRVSCGFITKETRVSFRSSTAQVHIFIQMSSEMWLFDDFGHLYFEKAVNGYLYDLFKLWKEKGCAHDVSITLFSRAFYDIKSKDELPLHMRECIQEDYAGRFYEDYYRVVVQNERYEDWHRTIDNLKSLFTTYDADVLHFHEKCGFTRLATDGIWNPRAAMGMKARERTTSDVWEKSSIEEEHGEFLKARSRRKSINVASIPDKPPPAWNSTASEGNLLEVINMALNVYEKFYMDRCFERTGKMSIVITPSIGAFDVNRDLMNITKQRSIDIGSCCDLVCLGERPLFAVPLFKINRDRSQYPTLVDEDYNVPHWLNLSYYTSRAQMESQIQGKTLLNSGLLEAINACNTGVEKTLEDSLNSEKQHESQFRSIKDEMPIINYEDYDSKVFKYHSKAERQEKFSYLLHRSTRSEYGERRQRVTYTIAANGLFADQQQLKKSCNIPVASKKLDENTEDFLSHSFSGNVPEEEGHSMHCRRMASSVTLPYNHFRRNYQLTPSKSRNIRSTSKALVNPFFPSRLNFKVTSNRLRWAHVYPVVSCNYGCTSQNKNMKGNASPSRESLFSDSSNVQQITPAYRIRQPRRHNLSECSEQGFNPGSYIESPSKGHSRLDSLCLTDLSANLHKFPHTESSSSLASSCNDFFGSYGRSRSIISGRFLQQASRHSQLFQDKDIVNHSCKISGLDPLLPVYDKPDWKSMTIPPILPITTDYFPDRQSLEQHYLFSEYTLVVEEIEAHFSGVYGSRHTPTLREVFNEMIYQRVAQGFQIIIMPKIIPTQQIGQNSRKPTFNKSSSLLSTTSITEEVILSMGRLFHKLTLHEKDIVVRRYTPRHAPAQQIAYDYTYRFCVPDSFYFDSSFTCFKTDPLDTYNWNYVDHHLLAQGCNATFVETLKFWRTRFIIVPFFNAATKKIIDEDLENCDIYEPKDSKERQSLIEKFLKFIEYVNGIRKERRKSLDPSINIYVDGGQRRESVDLPPTPQLGCFQKNEEPTSGQPQSESYNYRFTINSLYSDVIKSMMDPKDGLIFVASPLNWIVFPQNSFIASDAVFWLMKHIKGINTVSQAVHYMQRLIDSKLVCHASYRASVPFVFGHKIFYFVSEYQKEDEEMGSFIEKNFIEVKILTDVEEENLARRRNTQPASILKEVKANRFQGSSMFGQMQFLNVRMEIESKCERQEWGVLRHHELYTPTCAFEIYIEWLVATGSTLAERVFGWARRASSFGLSFLPAPCDPFSLSFVKQSDPLRGPIYVPMDIDCLEQGSMIDHSLLLNFQDSILKSFGFMREKCVTGLTLSQDYMISKHDELPKYIHCCGGMHIMVVSTLSSRRTEAGKTGPHGNRATLDQYEDFVIRQYNKQMTQGKSPRSGSTDTVGFLWASNFMLTKKWSSQPHETLHDKILRDLRRYCANDTNRMKVAWDTFKKSKDYTMFS